MSYKIITTKPRGGVLTPSPSPPSLYHVGCVSLHVRPWVKLNVTNKEAVIVYYSVQVSNFRFVNSP